MDIVGICRFSLVGRGDWKAYRLKSDDEIEAIALKQAETLFLPERMEARLESFEHLTLASIRAQTDDDFHFIVLASELMPIPYRKRLEQLCADVPQVAVRFFGITDTAVAQQRVYDELNLTLGNTIQFRLDDDDCVCVDYVERLKAKSRSMNISDDPFAISVDSTLYCVLSDAGSEIYYWPRKFFSAGAALKHNTKSIFNFGHFKLDELFRSGVISERVALATNDGKSDTTFTYEKARKRGFIRIYGDDIADRVRTHFPFLSEKGKALAGLTNIKHVNNASKSFQPITATTPSWLNDLAESKSHRGFFISANNFAIQHTHRRSNVLYVGFDDLSRACDKNRLRDPWGYEFAVKRHWSSLGVLAYRPDWFRSDELLTRMKQLQSEGFFKRYRKVVFSGVSMGGYAACAFSSLAPGSTVIAFSPQSTLAPHIADWDLRYPTGSSADWSGPFADAADELQSAEKAWIIFDPALPEDKRHAERLMGPSVELLHARYAEHFTAQFLRQIGALSSVVDDCISGEMTPARFYRKYRPARDYRRFLGGVVKKVLDRDRPDLATRLQRVLTHMNKPGLANEISAALARNN